MARLCRCEYLCSFLGLFEMKFSPVLLSIVPYYAVLHSSFHLNVHTLEQRNKQYPVTELLSRFHLNGHSRVSSTLYSVLNITL